MGLISGYFVVVAELLAPVDPPVGEDDDVPVRQLHCLRHTVRVTAKRQNILGRVADPDPDTDSIGSVDPDPGSRTAKMIKSRKFC
jgi:hypothetical protein